MHTVNKDLVRCVGTRKSHNFGVQRLERRGSACRREP